MKSPRISLACLLRIILATEARERPFLPRMLFRQHVDPAVVSRKWSRGAACV